MSDLLAGYLGFIIGGVLVLFWDNYKIRESNRCLRIMKMNTYRVTFTDAYDDYLLTRDVKAKYADEAKKIAVAELIDNDEYHTLANYRNIYVRRLQNEEH